MRILWIAVIAAILDLLLGDPLWMPHVVRLLGTVIGGLDRYLRSLTDRLPEEADRKQMERLCGILLCILVLGSTWVVWTVLRAVLYRISTWLGFAAECFLAYQLLAMRCLRKESIKVYHALAAGDVELARHNLSMIVGRDTAVLSREGIIRADVETVAENMSDGVVAPLFFLFLGGTLPMLLYKAVNTMDSMVGYRNETYQYFGTCAARLDDVLNFIPSRLSGLLLVAASWLCRMDGADAWQMFKRDRKKHASPNSAQTEAAMAGALGVTLGGDAWYFGVLHHKETLGEAKRSPEDADIKRANRLMAVGCVLAFLLFAAVRFLLTKRTVNLL